MEKNEEKQKFVAYFSGSLEIEAKDIEEAWKKWHKLLNEYEGHKIDIDDVDIWSD